jgi:hypothetical protein
VARKLLTFATIPTRSGQAMTNRKVRISSSSTQIKSAILVTALKNCSNWRLTVAPAERWQHGRTGNHPAVTMTQIAPIK